MLVLKSNMGHLAKSCVLPLCFGWSSALKFFQTLQAMTTMFRSHNSDEFMKFVGAQKPAGYSPIAINIVRRSDSSLNRTDWLHQCYTNDFKFTCGCVDCHKAPGCIAEGLVVWLPFFRVLLADFLLFFADDEVFEPPQKSFVTIFDSRIDSVTFALILAFVLFLPPAARLISLLSRPQVS